jgi:hypothetical protein
VRGEKAVFWKRCPKECRASGRISSFCLSWGSPLSADLIRTVTAETGCRRHPAARVSPILPSFPRFPSHLSGRVTDSDPLEAIFSLQQAALPTAFLFQAVFSPGKDAATDGRMIIFAPFFDFPFVLAVRYGRSSRHTGPVICLLSLRRMSPQLDCHEPH